MAHKDESSLLDDVKKQLRWDRFVIGLTNIILSVAGLILLYVGLKASGVAGAGELTASAFLLLLFMRE